MSTSTVTPSTLPRQRAHPLKSGSTKETALINYIDKQLLKVNRRHAKKFSSAIDEQAEPENKDERGYESFKDVVKDIEPIIDVIWVSGTPSLQIPYFISLAGLVNTYLPDYPFSPKSIFRLLKKLDIIFASLLLGEDVESGAPLSGFEGQRQVVSMTEKVRIKSIAETSRLVVVEARDRGDDETVKGDEDEDETDLDGGANDDDDDDFGTEDRYLEEETPGRWEMEAARIYERTIQILGDELGKGELIS
ncbi:hypothetical protein VTN77DRAFT_8546 [Rasamsonia byssochlamydoides]|uniref:uncharacterized protein n=1 Tax=Rasamsonia byssochlamydoides TaxID=89139 RepID=UPI0037442A9D